MHATTIKLWKRKNKEGKTYLAGPMTRLTRLVVIKNHQKTKNADPDYMAYILPNRAQDSGPSSRTLSD